MGREVLTQDQESLIIGTLLGDGNLENRKLNASLRIDHSINQNMSYKISPRNDFVSTVVEAG